MKKVLFLFLLLYSIVVSSQNEEKTIVLKDIDTEKPIEDATIFISKTKQTLLSNAEGTASFILNGISNIQITHSAYNTIKLRSNILKEKGVQVTQTDPHTDGEKSFNDVFASVDGDTVFFLGTQHDYFKTLSYPKGSIIIDPFRYMPNIDGAKIIRLGGGNASNI
jgi:hypothetical protein